MPLARMAPAFLAFDSMHWKDYYYKSAYQIIAHGADFQAWILLIWIDRVMRRSTFATSNWFSQGKIDYLSPAHPSAVPLAFLKLSQREPEILYWTCSTRGTRTPRSPIAWYRASRPRKDQL